MSTTQNNKTVWLINKHAAPLKHYATHQRTVYIAKYLMQYEYNVYIIGSGFIHNRNINLNKGGGNLIFNIVDGINFVHIKTLPYKKNGIKRVLSFFEFSIKLFVYRRKITKPNFIIHTSNIPFDGFIYFTARRLHAKYIIEVLDLWPESLAAYGILNRRNPLLSIFYKIEKFLYKNADNIVFSMEGGIDYIIDKKWDSNICGNIDLSKIRYINNGVDLDSFDRNCLNHIVSDPDINNPYTFKVIYMGSIRLVNGIQQLIDAAFILKKHTNIKFIIYGDGDDRNKTEEFCVKNNMTNVIFKNKWIDPKFVPYVLSSCSLNILNYLPNGVDKYGGSQNKLFQAIASSKPICCNLGMGYSIINKFNLGIDKKFSDANDYAKSILFFAKMDKQNYSDLCMRVREVASIFDYKELVKKYIELL